MAEINPVSLLCNRPEMNFLMAKKLFFFEDYSKSKAKFLLLGGWENI
jgi:hypothetical protein